MTMKDEKRWVAWKAINQADPYSAAVVTFAERWLKNMEACIARGATVADCAEECATLADQDIGITGFQYAGGALQIVLCWEHGEDLRVWFNATNPSSPLRDWSGRSLPAGHPEATWASVRLIEPVYDRVQLLDATKRGWTDADRWRVAASGIAFWPSEALARSYCQHLHAGEKRVPLPLEGHPRDDDSLRERALAYLATLDAAMHGFDPPPGVAK